MSEPLDFLERLARRARTESAPQGDVSAKILPRLYQPQSVMGPAMTLFATGYAAAASVALVYGYLLLNAMSNPLLSLFQQSVTIIP